MKISARKETLRRKRFRSFTQLGWLQRQHSCMPHAVLLCLVQVIFHQERIKLVLLLLPSWAGFFIENMINILRNTESSKTPNHCTVSRQCKNSRRLQLSYVKWTKWNLKLQQRGEIFHRMRREHVAEARYGAVMLTGSSRKLGEIVSWATDETFFSLS